MQTVSLFLGIPLNADLQVHLAKANPHVFALFVNNASDYLHEIEFEGVRYLGKRLKGAVDVAQLELTEKNICSLLYKLLPRELSLSLVLFPVLEN